MLSRLLGFLAAIASVAPALANATTPANGIPNARDVPLMKRYEGVQFAKVSRHASSSLSLPQTIYLMRHADKPAAAKDPDLSAAGVVRAGRLSGYFPSLLGNGQSLNYIFAAKASKVSNRSVETATPLAESLHLPINRSYANNSYRALAKAIRSSGSYDGKTILIVWHHGALPALARARRRRCSPEMARHVVQFDLETHLQCRRQRKPAADHGTILGERWNLMRLHTN